jgi:plastocyanin
MVGGGAGLATSRAAAEPATSQTSPKLAAAATTVRIDNFAFTPKTLTVPVGATVTWVNHDDVPHTATAKAAAGGGDAQQPAFDSNTIDSDERFSFTFTAAGTYPYYCKVHPHMTGTIIVVAK